MSAYAHPVPDVYANLHADFNDTSLTYTPAHAWCSQHLLKCMHTLRKKIIRACMPMQQCRSFFVMEANELMLSLARALCRLSFAARPAPSRQNQSPDAVRSKIRPNPRQLMTRSPLWCRTSIIRSSALLQASSSLSVGRMQSVATELTHPRDLFPPFFSRAFL